MLRGRVVTVKQDTLVIRMTSDLDGGPVPGVRGRQAAVILDESAVVTRSQRSVWKFSAASLVLLAIPVLLYVALVMLGE